MTAKTIPAPTMEDSLPRLSGQRRAAVLHFAIHVIVAETPISSATTE